MAHTVYRGSKSRKIMFVCDNICDIAGADYGLGRSWIMLQDTPNRSRSMLKRLA
jgi:hypothetical protein